MELDPIYLVIFVLSVAFVVLLLQRVSKPKGLSGIEGMMKGDESKLVKMLEDAADAAGEDLHSFLSYLESEGVKLKKELKDEDGFHGGWRFWRRRPWRTRRWWTAPYLTFDGPFVYSL